MTIHNGITYDFRNMIPKTRFSGTLDLSSLEGDERISITLLGIANNMTSKLMTGSRIS